MCCFFIPFFGTYILSGIMKPTFRRLILVVGGIAVIASSLFFIYICTIVLNEEYHSRLTQILRVNKSKVVQTSTEQDPLIRFVINRLSPEENAADVTLLLILNTNTPLGTILKSKADGLKAQAEDGSSGPPTLLETEELTAAKFRPGYANAITHSPRSSFPTFTSIDAFPFDKVSLRPMFKLAHADRSWLSHKIEVQKAFPGRQMSVRWDRGGVIIEFARSNLEIVYVLVVSIVFLIAAASVFVGSMLRKSSATGLESMLSIAGLLVAAAGYREILGVAKLPSTSVLEILVLGIPILLLAGSLLLSVFRAVNANDA